MSPTVLRVGPYRARIHVHIHSADGEAKFWIEPMVALATYTGLSKKQLRELQTLVEENENVIRNAWTAILEVTTISQHGFWLYWNNWEFFLLYENYPWFRDAKVKDILEVRLESPTHLYWPTLDVDLSLDILEEPEKYPLISSTARA